MFVDLPKFLEDRSVYGAGDSIPKGWIPLLKELDQKLAAIYPNYTVSQVKQKFGELRFYVSEPSWGEERTPAEEARFQKFCSLVEQYEEKSLTTCEYCGNNEGTVKGSGFFLQTYCPPCRAAVAEERAREADKLS